MADNYIEKRNRSNEMPVMEFHRKHLLLFLHRFRQFVAHFSTPSSSLLSHEIFLVIEAATTVARSDWTKLGMAETEPWSSFAKYFDAFDKMNSGLLPLDSGIALCLEALTVADNC
ncbi:MAG: hypothetical protein NTW03_03030 [Verrucomicrobia bacterium]|nr:hypothetical protein [Verrucomicrobiota bacterium]